METMVLNAVFLLSVVFADPEGDGTFNYLLNHAKDARAHTLQHSIAFSYSSDLGLKPGDTFWAKVEGVCNKVYAIDPVPKALESALPWGAPRRSYICDADIITFGGKEYKGLTE